ncbi:MAG: sulfatase [Niabella sp.]
MTKYIQRLSRTVLSTAAMLFAIIATGQANTKPNIIWIITEDMSTELGCYGDPYVQTPNLDKLASEGKRYTNMFATGSVCSPARSAMITGMYQTSIGAHNHRSHRNDGYKLPQPVEPITEYLRQAGYYTVNSALNQDGSIKGAGKTDYNFNLDKKPFDGFDWNKRKPGQPFYAQVMIYVTHRSPAWKKEVQEHQPQINPDKLKLPPYYPDYPIARDDWATYLESIQLMDTYVGNFLKKLDQEGLSENTVVIFSSDHGRCMARDKQFLYDGGIKIPCIIRWPGNIKPKSTDNALHSAIDISASILQLAGAAIPAYMEGRPFTDPDVQKRDYIVAARDRMDETVDMMRCVRDKRFKYIKNYYPERPYMQPNKYKEEQYPVWNLLKELKREGKLTKAQLLFTANTKPPEELYDIVKDPYELNNLAGNTSYLNQLNKMRNILEQWIIETGDKGQVPETGQ